MVKPTSNLGINMVIVLPTLLVIVRYMTTTITILGTIVGLLFLLLHDYMTIWD